ncbi:uncharacterized protein LOC132548658 [Ylistrum balloti]|uniref:uncharacterized protein LOC132548658 n=1 Tax=Ylistrum balloti TaxID=509963 RepID=UPI002905CA6C|nr:uncharacterized protein LOC132548658 [Ylistrum balloti]
MKMFQYGDEIVLLCRLMHLIHQFGTLALRTLLVKLLFVKYIQSRQATFTYFADKDIVVKERNSRKENRYSTRFRVPNPLPDIGKCFRNSKDGESLREFIEESFLTEIVDRYTPTLVHLRNKKVINPTQWETLFSNNTVNIHDLDISLLSILLFNTMNCKPTFNLKTLPQNDDITEGDDVLRIRMYRNKLAHLTSLVMTAADFNDMWRNISCAIVRLLGSTYQNDVDRLKDMTFDEATVIRYKELRQEWSETVTDIYQSLSDIQDEIRSIKKKSRHRKGIALKLNDSNELPGALKVLKKKGISVKVISLDETDSDSSESMVETVSRRKSTGCLKWTEELDEENTIRASKSTPCLEPGALQSKEKARPFYEMFSGGKDTSRAPRQWSSTDTDFTEDLSISEGHSTGCSSSWDSIVDEKAPVNLLQLTGTRTESKHLSVTELPQPTGTRTESKHLSVTELLQPTGTRTESKHLSVTELLQPTGTRTESKHLSVTELQQPINVPEPQQKPKKKTFWRSFKGLF